jgi:hypothetical protein
MPRKTKKPLTKAELTLKASRCLGFHPNCILNVVPNSGKSKYFIHYVVISRGKPSYLTELVAAKDLES